MGIDSGPYISSFFYSCLQSDRVRKVISPSGDELIQECFEPSCSEVRDLDGKEVG